MRDEWIARYVASLLAGWLDGWMGGYLDIWMYEKNVVFLVPAFY